MKKLIKKIILIFVLFFSFGNFSIINAAPGDAGIIDEVVVENRMGDPFHSSTDSGELSEKLGTSTGEEATGILSKIIKFARESIFNLLWVVVVGVLLYIGFKLIIGRGTPDIFKKAIMGLIYLIVGIILIFSAWAMIKVILGVGI